MVEIIEKKIEYKTNEKNGKKFINFNLKSIDPDVTKGEVSTSTVVEKVFAQGLQNTTNKYKDKDGNAAKFFGCRVIQDGVDGSMLLWEREHVKFAACGGVGDKVRIVTSLVKDQKGALRVQYNFTKVE